MPDEEPADWTDENLARIVSETYAQAVTDNTFYDQLVADPHQVLSARIKIPEAYRGQIHAGPKNKPMIILNVPSYETADPAGTREMPPADYVVLCTTLPPW